MTGNIKVQFNIRPEVSELITRAATQRGLTRSQYIQNLVIAAANKKQQLKSFETELPPEI